MTLKNKKLCNNHDNSYNINDKNNNVFLFMHLYLIFFTKYFLYFEYYLFFFFHFFLTEQELSNDDMMELESHNGMLSK